MLLTLSTLTRSALQAVAPPNPPDNAAYFRAAYALVVLVYGGYALTLLRRRARIRRVLDRMVPAQE